MPQAFDNLQSTCIQGFLLYRAGAELYGKVLLVQGLGAPVIQGQKTMVEEAVSANFIQAMGQHVSSVCVITTSHGGERFGLTATAVASVSAAPPRLLVCINKSGLTHEKIVASRHFGVSVLDESQLHIGQVFAGIAGRDVDRFASGTWRQGPLASPLLHGAAATFECRIASTLDQSTHSIFIADVVEAMAGIGLDALLYGARQFRTLRKLTTSPMADDNETLSF